jgi:hypothetical protein
VVGPQWLLEQRVAEEERIRLAGSRAGAHFSITPQAVRLALLPLGVGSSSVAS